MNYPHFHRPQSSVTYFHVNDTRFLENMESYIHSKVHVRVHVRHYCLFAIATGAGEGAQKGVLAAGPRDDAVHPVLALPSVFHSLDRLAAAGTILRDTDLRISIPSQAGHK